MALLILFPPNQLFLVKPPAPNTAVSLNTTGGADGNEIVAGGKS